MGKPVNEEKREIPENESPGENETAETENAKESREDIKFTSSATVKGEKGIIHCLTIVGQIEGHTVLPPENKSTKYEHIIPQLVAVEESPEIDGLLIILNTVGGDVEAGLAIAEMISGMKKPTVSLVLGGSHSIGVPLAVAAKYSFVARSATMTIHPIRVNGLVVGVPQTFHYFNKIQERVVDFVVSHSRMTAEDFKKYCFKVGELATDVGSILSGEEAQESGLIHEMGSLGNALQKLHEMIGESKKTKET